MIIFLLLMVILCTVCPFLGLVIVGIIYDTFLIDADISENAFLYITGYIIGAINLLFALVIIAKIGVLIK